MPSARDSNLLERAIKVALEAHGGQLDKAAQPYILHPLRCMLAVRSDVQRIAAVLHDVVEDTDWTLEALAAEGFPPDVVDIVDRLSRRKDESYNASIARVIESKDAIAVKLADLEDNLDVTRLSEVTDKDRSRLDMYVRTWHNLKALG